MPPRLGVPFFMTCHTIGKKKLHIWLGWRLTDPQGRWLRPPSYGPSHHRPQEPSEFQDPSQQGGFGWFWKPLRSALVKFNITCRLPRKSAKWCEEKLVFANVSSLAFEIQIRSFFEPIPQHYTTSTWSNMKFVMIFHQSAFPYVQKILSEIPWAFSFNNSFPLTRVRARQVVVFFFGSVNLHGNLRGPPGCHVSPKK